MAAERIRVSNISKLKKQSILFDANIWLYIFCPLGNYNSYYVTTYSGLFKGLLKSDNKIIIDLIILSELVNRWYRLGFDKYKASNTIENFKNYRKTEDYKEVTKELVPVISSKILRSAIICNKNYEIKNFEVLIKELESGTTDFNDRHIINLCKENKYYLLTHDADFVTEDIPIISDNNKFWK